MDLASTSLSTHSTCRHRSRRPTRAITLQGHDMRRAPIKRFRLASISFTAVMVAILAGCTGTATEIREHAPLAAHPGATYRGVTVAVLPFGGPNGPVARDVVIRVLAEREGASVISLSAVDSFLWNAKLEPSAYDPNTMAAIAAGLHASVIVWGQVDQFTPYHFDRFVPATPAYVEMTINTWSATGGQTKTATINRQGSLPFTIWDKQPTFRDVALDEVSDFFAGNQRR
jgi:hypothetical protein